jgi:hypothetical protein
MLPRGVIRYFKQDRNVKQLLQRPSARILRLTYTSLAAIAMPLQLAHTSTSLHHNLRLTVIPV